MLLRLSVLKISYIEISNLLIFCSTMVSLKLLILVSVKNFLNKLIWPKRWSVHQFIWLHKSSKGSFMTVELTSGQWVWYFMKCFMVCVLMNKVQSQNLYLWLIIPCWNSHPKWKFQIISRILLKECWQSSIETEYQRINLLSTNSQEIKIKLKRNRKDFCSNKSVNT